LATDFTGDAQLEKVREAMPARAVTAERRNMRRMVMVWFGSIGMEV
jgi:hypothetical protein